MFLFMDEVKSHLANILLGHIYMDLSVKKKKILNMSIKISTIRISVLSEHFIICSNYE